MPAGQRQPGQREAEPACRGSPPGSVVRRFAQADRDGEDEEGLGELLEGALGEVGGAEVGDGDHRRRQQAPARRRSPAGRPARSAPVRTPIAKISPTKACPRPIPGTAAMATARPCGPSG